MDLYERWTKPGVNDIKLLNIFNARIPRKSNSAYFHTVIKKIFCERTGGTIEDLFPCHYYLYLNSKKYFFLIVLIRRLTHGQMGSRSYKHSTFTHSNRETWKVPPQPLIYVKVDSVGTCQHISRMDHEIRVERVFIF